MEEQKENNLETKEVVSQNNSQKQIVSAIIIAGVLIAGAILLKGSSVREINRPIDNNNNVEAVAKVSPLNDLDHVLGYRNSDSDVKIIIIEYSDLECPYCKVFHETMHKVVENSNGKVAWVFRHYPIAQLHPKAFHEAEATECAFEQGGNDAFWKYTDRIFEITPSNNGLDETELPKIAEYIGLNVVDFKTCLDSGKYKNNIEANISSGNDAGVSGTPSSFILDLNGKVIDTIPGAQPYEAVMQRLSEIK